jgi:hypothetical protein
MKKYELLVKFGRKVVHQQIFEFTEEEQKKYLEEIVAEEPELLYGEMEDVFIRNMGIKRFDKEYPYPLDNPRSLYSRELKEIAEQYPDFLVAAALQAQCYHSVPCGDVDFPQVCEKSTTVIKYTGNFSFLCKILEE